MASKNIGESVNARLRTIAQENKEDMMSLQRRYALERLLYRITQTEWGDRIALKGALIFVMHYGDTHRPTADLDINGYDEDGGVDDLKKMIEAAIAIDVADGVVFDPDTIDIQKERNGTISGGKIHLRAKVNTSDIVVRVDAGFGNAITPAAEMAEYPSLLKDMPRPRCLAYPFEVMIAEKLHAMARHGAESSRLRDYYDIWALAENRDFDVDRLADAVRSTFANFDMAPPEPGMDGLSSRFVKLWEKQWKTFCKSKGLKFSPPELTETVERITEFVNPVLDYINDGPRPSGWTPEGGWEKAPEMRYGSF